MKVLLRSFLVLTAASAASFAQQWEFGAGGGGSFLNSVPVTGGTGSANAGIQTGAAFGGFVGYNQNKLIGGELHYGFLQSNLKLTSGGSTATFSGVSHIVHYDLTFRTTRNRGKLVLFAATGGGMRVFRGTGSPRLHHRFPHRSHHSARGYEVRKASARFCSDVRYLLRKASTPRVVGPCIFLQPRPRLRKALAAVFILASPGK